MENFEKCRELDKTKITINSDTVVRIFYSEKNQVIKDLEILKIIGMTKTALRLSNGVLVSKASLFPYHYSTDFRHGEEYYLLENISITRGDSL